MFFVFIQRVRSIDASVAKIVPGLDQIEINFPNRLVVREISWEVVVRFKSFFMAVSLLRIRPEQLKVKFDESLGFLVLTR